MNKYIGRICMLYYSELFINNFQNLVFRADSGFSTLVFYKFARDYLLKFPAEIAANNVLKKKTK